MQAQDSLVRSERLASVGRLAAGLAHEIGNPIAAILGFQELLLEGGVSADEQRDFLQRMKRETERVNGVLRQLLDFARPAAGGADQEDDKSITSVPAAVDHITALVRPQKAFSNVDLDVSLPEGVPPVAMGRERLEQVLLNLLLNAADTVPESGGKISLSVTTVGECVRLLIEDNGGGIDPAVRNRLFEPFVTSKEVGKGTGLGLAVCRGLIESASGTIVAEDGEAGARFVLTLPIAQ
jgi:signal transduction histidine kinase